MIIQSKRLNGFIWPIDGNKTGSTTPVLSRPESNGNEGALHIPQTPRAQLSPVECTNCISAEG